MVTLRTKNFNPDYTGSVSILDSTLGSGNSIDFIRTSVIIDESDKKNIKLDGSSYLAFFTGFIPRQIWPEKPNVSLGPWVKTSIYGYTAKKNGYPPGMIAEAYLNFGLLGIIIAMYIFGGFLKIFYLSFQPLLGNSIVATAIYGASTWRLSFSTIGLTFAQGVYQALQFCIPILLLFIIQRYLKNNNIGS